MHYIDPHIHMISRVTDDYHRMALSGCAAISEPAFWAGFDRGSANAFHDYFRQLTEYEPRRAAQFHIRHYCWLCINAKEAENVSLSREVSAGPLPFAHSLCYFLVPVLARPPRAADDHLSSALLRP
jgi:hypothetical protein